MTGASRAVAPDGAAAIALDGLWKSFPAAGGARQVLAGVDLQVRSGEIVALAGRSGSGKTTVLTIVAGWEAPDAGAVVVLGGATPPADLTWRQLAVLPQSLGMLDELTVAENVGLPLRLANVGGAADPGEIMDRLGVGHLGDRYPSEVSLGEQQRAALARAAVGRPRVLLADEPTMHQNREWSEAVMATLADLAARGTACVVATHDAVALAAADRVVEMHEGRLRPR